MTDGVLLRETLKDSDLDKYRYENINKFTPYVHTLLFVCNKKQLSTVLFETVSGLLSWMKPMKDH